MISTVGGTLSGGIASVVVVVVGSVDVVVVSGSVVVVGGSVVVLVVVDVDVDVAAVVEVGGVVESPAIEVVLAAAASDGDVDVLESVADEHAVTTSTNASPSAALARAL